MNISFDASALSSREAKALSAFLSSLYPLPSTAQPAQQPQPVQSAQFTELPQQVQQSQPAQPAQQPQPDQPVLQLPNAKAVSRVIDKFQTAVSALADMPPTPPTPTVATEPVVRRGRRSNAQIAAEKEAQRVAEEGHPEEAEAILEEAGTESPKPITADDFRTLLNGFIQRHSMEEAIGQLKAYDCNRVSEALALDPAKLRELVAALNG